MKKMDILGYKEKVSLIIKPERIDQIKTYHINKLKNKRTLTQTS